ncbi:MAG: hypothetical protein Q8K73_05635, partial [Anaerolineales bacterium]|nr:hypothetical protein [Anaerolineales bacterium]
MQIEIVTQADDELYGAFQRLVPQLTDHNPPRSRADVSALLRHAATPPIAARNENGQNVGAVTHAAYR